MIWGFGTAAVDMRIKTADYGEKYKDKLLGKEIKWMGGGSTSNFLVQVMRLGGMAGWLGKLGEDAVGATIEKMLESEQINCSAVIRDSNAVSPFNVAVYAGDAMRRIGGFLLPNCMAEITSEEVTGFIHAIDHKDWLLIEVGEIPLNTCIQLSHMARQKGINIVIDVDLDPIKQCGGTIEQVQTLFSLCDVLMPNANAMLSLYGDTPIDKIAQILKDRYGCCVVITVGEQGAAYIDEKSSYKKMPAIPIDAVDTVGAGDAFHGGVVYGLCAGLNIERAVVLGNICGAHNCKTFGARNGMIRAQELNKYGFMDLINIDERENKQ